MASILETYIENLLKSVDITTPTELNEQNIAERLNLFVHTWDEVNKSAYYNSKIHIYLNEELDEVDRWKVFCHEVGHALYHYGDQSKLPFPFVELQERQADNFMIHLCVPTFMVRNMNLPFYKWRAASIVAETFNVDIPLAVHRLNMLETEELLDKYSRMGGY